MRRRRRERGTGSVYYDRTKKRYIARWPLGNGRFVRASAKSELAAKQELEQLRRRFSLDGDPADGTLDDYLAQWLATLMVRKSTKVSYTAHVNQHISPLLGGIPVARLRSLDVRRLIADRVAAGLSPASVRRIHATLHAALEQGVRERSLAENVAHGVALPEIERPLIEPMSEDDADRIRDAVHGTFLEPLVELLLGSGLRLGEALGLNQGDVHEGYVMVRRSKTGQRAVDISDDAYDAIRAHIVALKRRGPKEAVFQAERRSKSGRLSPSGAYHAFQRALQDAGLPRMRLHDLRHGTASRLLHGGASLKEVAEQLGHRSIQTTDRFYAHIARGRLAENVKMLNRRKA